MSCSELQQVAVCRNVLQCDSESPAARLLSVAVPLQWLPVLQ